MKKILLIAIIFLYANSLFAQTRIDGTIEDESGNPIVDAIVYFSDYSHDTQTDEKGKFSLYSDETKNKISITALGFVPKDISIDTNTLSPLKIVLKAENELKEIVIYSGKTSKKDNPALDILRKIWKHRRKNGLHKFDQYAYKKYEKIQFDFHSIDSAFIKKPLFRNMEFVFNYVDTSKITGKTFLPIFINEQASKVYGDNLKKLSTEQLLGNKSSGFENDEAFTEFVKNLYVDYDVYDNYINLFNKDFTSPLSRTGIDVYNYVLHDTLMENGRKTFHIIYYPRRKAGLTFKGEFFVDEQTWAVTKINMASNEGANVNWIKDFYVEQEFRVISDELILLVKDFIMTDFSLQKKEQAKGMYGKRTTYYSDFVFDDEKPTQFYLSQVNDYEENIHNQSDDFWNLFRTEKLDKNEQNLYEMFHLLNNNKKFKTLTTIATTLSNGYVRLNNIDYGNLYSFLGHNDIEGIRTRIGMRTYFNRNDMWRLEGYLAYGFKDEKIKYALRGKQMLNKDLRLIAHMGYKNDIEQLSARLIHSSDLLGRKVATSSILVRGDNSKLTRVKHFSTGIELEPLKNFKIETAYHYRELAPASIQHFSKAFEKNGEIKEIVKQNEWNLSADITPNRKYVGHGVEQTNIGKRFPRLMIDYTMGIGGLTNADFNYHKLQMYYRYPFIVGGFGTMTAVVEAGKTFGTVPLSLLNVLPGNQSFFSSENRFNQLDYYEFVTDQYFTFHLTHNFNGKIFSRIPYLRDWQLREYIGFRGALGSISNANKSINRSMINYQAPSEKMYYEYFVGIGNIFKIMRVDFCWRGNYLENPNARKMDIKVGIEITF